MAETETKYLDSFQSGFRPGFGIVSALVALTDDLLQGRDRELLLLLDLTVAFGTIGHCILLVCLFVLGVKGTCFTVLLLEWLVSENSHGGLCVYTPAA